MTKGKRTKGQEILYKILHRKLWIEQHEPYSIPRVNSGATKEEAVPTPLVPPVMSLIFSISHEESESLRSYDLSSSLENLGSCCLFISINPFIQECMVGTTCSGISYQLRDIYSIYRYCWNIATYIHVMVKLINNGNNEIISFVVKFLSQPA